MQNIRRCDNWQAWISSFADSSWHAINLRQPLLRHWNFPWNVFSRFKQISFNYLRFFSVPWWNIRAVAIQIPFVWIRRNSNEATNSIIKSDGKKFRGSANIIPKMFNCKWGKNLRRKYAKLIFFLLIFSIELKCAFDRILWLARSAFAQSLQPIRCARRNRCKIKSIDEVAALDGFREWNVLVWLLFPFAGALPIMIPADTDG